MKFLSDTKSFRRRRKQNRSWRRKQETKRKKSTRDKKENRRNKAINANRRRTRKDFGQEPTPIHKD